MTEIIFRRDERVALALLDESYLPFIIENMNDPAITRNLAARYPLYEHHEREWVEKVQKSRTDIVFVLLALDRDTTPPIGVMGLHQINLVNRTAGTGAWIAPEFQGQGYGTRAKMLLLDYAFNELNLYGIRSSAYAFNVKSIAYNKKCGYREIGRLPGWRELDNERVDEVLLAVTRADWLPIWEQWNNCA